MSSPLSVEQVLQQELDALTARRGRGNIYIQLHRAQLRALCLSGGGIRSATFALGVLQGLARKGLLAEFDYLSTVSGGGYIGGWLSSWIARTSLPEVIAQLRQRPDDPKEPEPAPIRHLRSYSNYLTPRLGLLSADTWTLTATYIRNLFLNWVALVPALIAVLSLPLLLVQLVSWQPVGDAVTGQFAIGLVLAVVAVGAGIAAVRYIHVNRPRQRGTTEGTGTFDEMKSQGAFLRQCLMPLLIATIAATICWAWGTSYASPMSDLFQQAPAWLILGSIGAVIHLVGWLMARVATPGKHWQWLTALGTGFAGGVVTTWLAHFAPPLWDLTLEQRGEYAWLAVPVLLGVVIVSSHLYVGYTSTRQSDAEREWSARFSGWVLIVIAAWLVAFGLVIHGPMIVAWVIGGSWMARAASVGGALSGVFAAMIGKKGSTSKPASEEPSRLWSGVALALATVFLAWLAIVLSWLGGTLMEVLRMATDSGDIGSTHSMVVATATLAVLLAFGLLSGRFIDTNMFSLHAMYRTRLIRAYLGASREAGKRDPNPFTGFDDNDNMHLRELWPQPAVAGGNQRPLHVINATLNLVEGEKLAWQERKAESFTFSPLHCGSANVGYRLTQEDPRDAKSPGYAGDLGVSLGTAMAISGAAASPEMGYHSSPLLSLLLTFFNVRLGWWLGNPGEAGKDVLHRSSPRSSLGPIIDEALGRTDDQNKYVYLSDGGHFENLGFYEMVLRRCQTIVVVDTTADPLGHCEDLGNAIRKIRIDLGIPVDIDITGQAKGSACAVGSIGYDCVDEGASAGVLIYIKPALSESDPADVHAYATANPAFPHESTADQWFTESQFESYRALGSHVIDTVAAGEPPAKGATMAWFARKARACARH